MESFPAQPTSSPAVITSTSPGPLASCGASSIAHDLVSLVAVTDPFGAYDIELLKGAFRDLIVPFKEHYIV
jgi:hypothetical protein